MAKGYDFKESEPKIIQFWDENKTYKFDSKNTTKPIFSFDTPPPTVSGTLHMGHAFGDTQQDFIARYKRMQGFNVLMPFGTDDNGLPTLRLVEKDKKVKASKMPREEFIELCLKAIKEEYVPEFLSDAKRLGTSNDWDLFYSTIDERSRRISQKSFINLYKMGREYRIKTPALWCTTCQTTIAQVELEDEEKILFSKIASHTTWVKPIGEEIELVGVHFKPNAISLFTDTSLCCLPKQINPEIIFEGNLKQLSTDIIKTKDVKNRFQIIETFLLASIKNKPNIRLDSVYNKIIQQQGKAKILSISKQLNITSRTIRNDFKEKIGCSPKHLSRIIRFHSTLNKIISNIPQNQSLDLAFENGYFDQSHFINDFKYFSSLTPKQLFIKNPNFRFFQF